MHRPRICIVSPALASANNGNWQTAWRWSRMLAPDFDADIALQWDGTPCDLMLALHARRSAASIARWARDCPRRPLAVVLTGTDLYRDILVDPEAARSLELAQRLVVLQDLGPRALPVAQRGKCRVIFQSTSARRTLPKTGRHLRVLMVGHLRDEKSPGTYFDAVRLLAHRSDILLDHIGAPIDAALGDQAARLAGELPTYRWLGGLDRETTRRHIQRAHALVHASVIEGGAHVVMEAVRSGTPVLASRIDGNVGMLGTDYAGYFEVGDAAGLARLLLACRDAQRQDARHQDPQRQSHDAHGTGSAMLRRLRAQCAARAHLFDPARERRALLQMVHELLEKP